VRLDGRDALFHTGLLTHRSVNLRPSLERNEMPVQWCL